MDVPGRGIAREDDVEKIVAGRDSIEILEGNLGGRVEGRTEIDEVRQIERVRAVDLVLAVLDQRRVNADPHVDLGHEAAGFRLFDADNQHDRAGVIGRRPGA